MSRCTGHCCRRFPIGDCTPEILQEMVAAAKEKMPGSAIWLDEISNIADMVIWLGVEHHEGVGFRHYYTCKHLDAKSGDCMNYAKRPRMCSDYPYGGECKYVGCTMKREVAFENAGQAKAAIDRGYVTVEEICGLK